MTVQLGKKRRERETRNVLTKFGQGLIRVALDATDTWAAGTTLVEYDTVYTDHAGWFNTTTARYTPKSPGFYLVCAGISANGALGSGSILYVNKNGVIAQAIDSCQDATRERMNGSCIVDMDGDDDYITISVFTANTVASLGFVTSNYLHIVQIGYNKP